jgi:hypothetical protein
MTFEIRDANGMPISNLEPLMAAGGHCVIILYYITTDAREFPHFIVLKKLLSQAGEEDRCYLSSKFSKAGPIQSVGTIPA